MSINMTLKYKSHCPRLLFKCHVVLKNELRNFLKLFVSHTDTLNKTH